MQAKTSPKRFVWLTHMAHFRSDSRKFFECELYFSDSPFHKTCFHGPVLWDNGIGISVAPKNWDWIFLWIRPANRLSIKCCFRADDNCRTTVPWPESWGQISEARPILLALYERSRNERYILCYILHCLNSRSIYFSTARVEWPCTEQSNSCFQFRRITYFLPIDIESANDPPGKAVRN